MRHAIKSGASVAAACCYAVRSVRSALPPPPLPHLAFGQLRWLPLQLPVLSAQLSHLALCLSHTHPSPIALHLSSSPASLPCITPLCLHPPPCLTNLAFAQLRLLPLKLSVLSAELNHLDLRLAQAPLCLFDGCSAALHSLPQLLQDLAVVQAQQRRPEEVRGEGVCGSQR